jgi:hypothetical protein
MYALPYVGAGLVEFNVSWQVFVAPLGADLTHSYTGREYALNVKKDSSLLI